jgi:hypothetical protein
MPASRQPPARRRAPHRATRTRAREHHTRRVRAEANGRQRTSNSTDSDVMSAEAAPAAAAPAGAASLLPSLNIGALAGGAVDSVKHLKELNVQYAELCVHPTADPTDVRVTALRAAPAFHCESARTAARPYVLACLFAILVNHLLWGKHMLDSSSGSVIFDFTVFSDISQCRRRRQVEAGARTAACDGSQRSLSARYVCLSCSLSILQLSRNLQDASPVVAAARRRARAPLAADRRRRAEGVTTGRSQPQPPRRSVRTQRSCAGGSHCPLTGVSRSSSRSLAADRLLLGGRHLGHRCGVQNQTRAGVIGSRRSRSVARRGARQCAGPPLADSY